MIDYVVMLTMFACGGVSAFIAVRVAARNKHADLRADLETTRAQLQSTRTRLELAEASERALLTRCEHLTAVRDEDLRKLFPRDRLPYLPGCVAWSSDRGGDDVVR